MENYIEMIGITKVYPNGVVANDSASLSVRKGEIHAVAGENGAGKSTIMKVLYGAERAEGEIYIGGKKVEITSPKVANALGIGMVYQHFMLVKEFPAYQNIFFGIEETDRFGVLKKKEMLEKAEELCKTYDMPIDLNEPCGNMSVSNAQKVEILKVLARGADILILDEPTAVLTPQETEQLFRQLRLLKENGYTVIIITHKLKEIKELCDRITIMRGGKTVGTYNVADISESEISRLMVGRDVATEIPKKDCRASDVVLEVKDLSVKGKGEKLAVDHVSFRARKGEILCMAGVEGNGQREVVSAITGLSSAYSGDVLFEGKPIKKQRIKAIRNHGLVHIPEDRLKTGCDAGSSIRDNLISLDYDKNSAFGFINYKKLNARSLEQMRAYEVKGSLHHKMAMLSGGNMQKVIVARELENDPVLVVADQPTRGVDVGAIEAIHKKLVEIRDEGKAVILISADLSEVFRLSDRIIVFHEGKITAEISDVSSVDEIRLGRYMLGLETMEANDDET